MYTVTKERDDYKEFIINLDEDLETIDTKYLRPGSLAYCSGSGIHYVWGPDFKWYNKHTGYAYGEVEIITLPAGYGNFDEDLSPEAGGHLYSGNEEIIPEWNEELYNYGKFDLIFNNITFSVEEDSMAESFVAWCDNKIVLTITDWYKPYLAPWLEIIYDIITDTTVYRINYYLATEEQVLRVINAFKEYGKIENSIIGFQLYGYDPYAFHPEEYIGDSELDYIISNYIDSYND